MQDRIKRVPVRLGNGAQILIELTEQSGDEDVAFASLSFADVSQTLEGIAASLGETLARAKPQKATVELGLEVALESGRLAAILVRGGATANFKVTLEWSRVDT